MINHIENVEHITIFIRFIKIIIKITIIELNTNENILGNSLPTDLLEVNG